MPSSHPAQIVSASRREDIPASQGDWLLRQIHAGYVDVPNPFSKKTCRVSLQPADVGAIVFWSKNYSPFFPTLEKINSLYDHRFLFHFTINGFQGPAKELFEPNIPNWQIAVQAAAMLSSTYGPETVLWRFDPIIFSSITPTAERLTAFATLAANLDGVVRRCYISFVDLYGKVRRRFARVTEEHQIAFPIPRFEDQVNFVRRLKQIASQHSIRLFTCCENDIADAGGITRGHCVDARLLQRLYPDIAFTTEIRPTRRECGCYFSRDIGTYNRCRHRCLYCYATQ